MNPFWDEHFLFDLDERSSMIKFEVFDREKPPGDDFLGRSQIPVVELRRMPSSRQIIPLSGRPGATGTVTVEFLFMEPADHSGMSVGLPQEPAPTDSLSPRRHIETNRTLTPGGTMVTTTTTTTEKPRDHKANVEPFDESPHRIQKTEAALVSRPAAADYSPYSHGSQAFNTDSAVMPPDVMNGGESVADVAQRELKEKQQSRRPRTPTKTSTLIITGVQRESPVEAHASHRSSMQKMSESDMPDTHSLSTGPGEHREMKKSKSFASAIRKRFNRPKKQRSQSADRAPHMSREYDDRDESLLKPPSNPGTKTTDSKHDRKSKKDDMDNAEISGNLRKSRSHSFSNSLKRIFRRKKKDPTGPGYPSSRESSVSRASTRPQDDASIHQGSPNLNTYRDHYHSPDRPGDGALLLSTSVPPHLNSPLYDH